MALCLEALLERGSDRVEQWYRAGIPNQLSSLARYYAAPMFWRKNVEVPFKWHFFAGGYSGGLRALDGRM
jgi:hypothetical protein